MQVQSVENVHLLIGCQVMISRVRRSNNSMIIEPKLNIFALWSIFFQGLFDEANHNPRKNIFLLHAKRVRAFLFTRTFPFFVVFLQV